VNTGGMAVGTFAAGGSLKGEAVIEAAVAAEVASDGFDETSGSVESTKCSIVEYAGSC
jgi:hypothetical protein